jgi:hypothetical protein
LLDKLMPPAHLDGELNVLLLDAVRLRPRPPRVVRELLRGAKHIGGVPWCQLAAVAQLERGEKWDERVEGA